MPQIFDVIANENARYKRNKLEPKFVGGVCVLSRCFLGFSVGVEAFVIGLGQISSFFSPCMYI